MQVTARGGGCGFEWWEYSLVVEVSEHEVVVEVELMRENAEVVKKREVVGARFCGGGGVKVVASLSTY